MRKKSKISQKYSVSSRLKTKQPYLKDIIIDHPLSGKDKESRELWRLEQRTWSDIPKYIYSILDLGREEKQEDEVLYPVEVSKIKTRMWVFDVILIFLAFVFCRHCRAGE